MTALPTQTPSTQTLENAVDYLSAVVQEMKRHAQADQRGGYKATKSEIAEVQAVIDDLTAEISARKTAAAAGQIDPKSLRHGHTASTPSTPKYPTVDVGNIIQRAFRDSGDVIPDGDIH